MTKSLLSLARSSQLELPIFTWYVIDPVGEASPLNARKKDSFAARSGPQLADVGDIGPTRQLTAVNVGAARTSTDVIVAEQPKSLTAKTPRKYHPGALSPSLPWSAPEAECVA